MLIAEDMHLIRGALAALLGREDDLEVVAELADAAELVRRARATRPDVALIDIGLPGQDGISAAAELQVRVPGCRSVILTGFGTPAALRRALAAGVHGFVVKDVPSEELARCVRRVARGERVIDPALAVAALSGEDSPLTARELDVLRIAAEGAAVGEVARRLYLSEGTVRNYLARIIGKVGARTRVEAIMIARDEGWLWPADGRNPGLVRARPSRIR
ncbi:response regulator [Rhizohabitans arisaemae]|uniref:response regulator n=1 Tax=Rhizohabitans arisaemae TaxID=2720610 RepID=UPI003D1617F3